MTQFLLNGAPRSLADIEPGRTVLDHLRLHERLTGTKEGCAEGDCGACTIAIGRKHGDGLKFDAVNACIMLAADLHGCAVVTAEGLTETGVLAPVQQAMVDCHASQCGFCTPGFVMSLFALSQSATVPDHVTILDALAGNLCRCTGYRPIVAAAESLGIAPDSRISGWCQALDALDAADEAPATLAGLDDLLARQPMAKLTAGTTDLGVAIAKHGVVPPHMVSLRNLPELKMIEAHDGYLRIGAAATYSQILPYLEGTIPNFARLLRRLGSLQIRNLGTMGGNLCNASPIGDSAPCLIALNAKLILRNAAGERELGIEDFFTGYRKTALQPGEYLLAIEIPYLNPNEKFYAYKLAKRFDQDISTVAAAFKIEIDGGAIKSCRVGFGGMAATPLRVPAIEDALTGQPVAAASFTRAASIAGDFFKPLSDFRATADYRLSVAAGFLHRLGAEIAQTPADIWAL